MGGLSRKAYMIRQIESEVDKPVLRLDAGALLFEQSALPTSLLQARTIQARGVSRAMQAMNYTAIGTAPQDLAAGLEFLGQQQQKFSLPWLSANLRDKTGKGPLQPFLMTKAGETSVAIIGLTGEPVGKAAGTPSGEYRLLPWQEVLPDILKQVTKHAEMVILLSSFPEAVNREIAGRYPDIHLIIQSGTFPAGKAPQLVGNTVITQVAARGKFLGRMDIDWQPSRRWGQEQSTSLLRQTRDSLDRINWRLGRLEKRFPDREGLAQNGEYQKLREEQDRLTAEIAQLEQAPLEEQTGLSSYSSLFIPLKVSLPEDPEIQKIVAQTKQEVNQAGRKHIDADQRPNQPVASIAADMSGWKTCASCHAEQTAFWQNSRHAGAWQTLATVEQQFNQECLLCHVTLPTYDQEIVHRENLLTTLPQEFQQVGCEACHGPGAKHVADPDQERPLAITAKTCLSCHTPEHDTTFDYGQKLQLIRCPPAASKNGGLAKSENTEHPPQ
ncbi:MAG: UshA-like (seleno)protein [Desulfobulbaceae bacterium]